MSRNSGKTRDCCSSRKRTTQTILEKIWSNLKRCKEEATWLANLGNSPEQCQTEITKTDVQEKLKKMSNWKALVPDYVQVFWIKHLSILHARISRQYQDQINHPEEIKKWLTTAELC